MQMSVGSSWTKLKFPEYEKGKGSWMNLVRKANLLDIACWTCIIYDKEACFAVIDYNCVPPDPIRLLYHIKIIFHVDKLSSATNFLRVYDVNFNCHFQHQHYAPYCRCCHKKKAMNLHIVAHDECEMCVEPTGNCDTNFFMLKLADFFASFISDVARIARS